MNHRICLRHESNPGLLLSRCSHHLSYSDICFTIWALDTTLLPGKVREILFLYAAKNHDTIYRSYTSRPVTCIQELYVLETILVMASIVRNLVEKHILPETEFETMTLASSALTELRLVHQDRGPWTN